MKRTLIFIMLLVMVSAVWGESVILKDGRTLKGEIVGKKSDQIYLNSEGNIYLINLDLVQEIKNEGNQPITGLIYRKKDFIQKWAKSQDVIELIPKDQIKKDLSVFRSGIQKTHETKMNWKPVLLSVLFGALAWDYFATAGDINDSIEDLKDMEDALNIDLGKDIKAQKKIKTRKTITASFLTAASVVSFAVSFERIEIKASSTSVEIGYKF